jgi:RNase P/RNase MRP subunit p29
MPITPNNLIYHELIGLPVRAYPSKGPKSIGSPVVGGVVVDETHQTIVVETGDKQRKRIIKNTHMFRFTLARDEKPVVVEVDGDLLMGTPEKRLKKMRKIK